MSNMKHVVGFSGGIDSQACALWVRRKYPAEDVILLNADAGGNEHPLTTEFIAEYSRRVHPVITVQAIVADLGGRGTREGETRDRRQEFADTEPLTFERLVYIKQVFPSRMKQFCTEHLKLVPQVRWLNENLRAKGIDFVRYNGVRCDESQKRKDTPESQWDKLFGCMLYHPIRCWTKAECFAVVKHAGEPINPLYTMGFSRVGCAPCVNSGKDDVRQWAARFPAMIDKVREWEQKVGRTFFMPIVPGMTIN